MPISNNPQTYNPSRSNKKTNKFSSVRSDAPLNTKARQQSERRKNHHSRPYQNQNKNSPWKRKTATPKRAVRKLRWWKRKSRSFRRWWRSWKWSPWPKPKFVLGSYLKPKKFFKRTKARFRRLRRRIKRNRRAVRPVAANRSALIISRPRLPLTAKRRVQLARFASRVAQKLRYGTDRERKSYAQVLLERAAQQLRFRAAHRSYKQTLKKHPRRDARWRKRYFRQQKQVKRLSASMRPKRPQARMLKLRAQIYPPFKPNYLLTVPKSLKRRKPRGRSFTFKAACHQAKVYKARNRKLNHAWIRRLLPAAQRGYKLLCNNREKARKLFARICLVKEHIEYILTRSELEKDLSLPQYRVEYKRLRSLHKSAELNNLKLVSQLDKIIRIGLRGRNKLNFQRSVELSDKYFAQDDQFLSSSEGAQNSDGLWFGFTKNAISQQLRLLFNPRLNAKARKKLVRTRAKALKQWQMENCVAAFVRQYKENLPVSRKKMTAQKRLHYRKLRRARKAHNRRLWSFAKRYWLRARPSRSALSRLNRSVPPYLQLQKFLKKAVFRSSLSRFYPKTLYRSRRRATSRRFLRARSRRRATSRRSLKVRACRRATYRRSRKTRARRKAISKRSRKTFVGNRRKNASRLRLKRLRRYRKKARSKPRSRKLRQYRQRSFFRRLLKRNKVELQNAWHSARALNVILALQGDMPQRPRYARRAIKRAQFHARRRALQTQRHNRLNVGNYNIRLLRAVLSNRLIQQRTSQFRRLARVRWTPRARHSLKTLKRRRWRKRRTKKSLKWRKRKLRRRRSKKFWSNRVSGWPYSQIRTLPFFFKKVSKSRVYRFVAAAYKAVWRRRKFWAIYKLAMSKERTVRTFFRRVIRTSKERKVRLKYSNLRRAPRRRNRSLRSKYLKLVAAAREARMRAILAQPVERPRRRSNRSLKELFKRLAKKEDEFASTRKLEILERSKELNRSELLTSSRNQTTVTRLLNRLYRSRHVQLNQTVNRTLPFEALRARRTHPVTLARFRRNRAGAPIYRVSSLTSRGEARALRTLSKFERRDYLRNNYFINEKVLEQRQKELASFVYATRHRFTRKLSQNVKTNHQLSQARRRALLRRRLRANWVRKRLHRGKIIVRGINPLNPREGARRLPRRGWRFFRRQQRSNKKTAWFRLKRALWERKVRKTRCSRSSNLRAARRKLTLQCTLQSFRTPLQQYLQQNVGKLAPLYRGRFVTKQPKLSALPVRASTNTFSVAIKSRKMASKIRRLLLKWARRRRVKKLKRKNPRKAKKGIKSRKLLKARKGRKGRKTPGKRSSLRRRYRHTRQLLTVERQNRARRTSAARLTALSSELKPAKIRQRSKNAPSLRTHFAAKTRASIRTIAALSAQNYALPVTSATQRYRLIANRKLHQYRLKRGQRRLVNLPTNLLIKRAPTIPLSSSSSDNRVQLDHSSLQRHLGFASVDYVRLVTTKLVRKTASNYRRFIVEYWKECKRAKRDLRAARKAFKVRFPNGIKRSRLRPIGRRTRKRSKKVTWRSLRKRRQLRKRARKQRRKYMQKQRKLLRNKTSNSDKNASKNPKLSQGPRKQRVFRKTRPSRGYFFTTHRLRRARFLPLQRIRMLAAAKLTGRSRTAMKRNRHIYLSQLSYFNKPSLRTILAREQLKVVRNLRRALKARLKKVNRVRRAIKRIRRGKKNKKIRKSRERKHGRKGRWITSVNKFRPNKRRRTVQPLGARPNRPSHWRKSSRRKHENHLTAVVYRKSSTLYNLNPVLNAAQQIRSANRYRSAYPADTKIRYPFDRPFGNRWNQRRNPAAANSSFSASFSALNHYRQNLQSGLKKFEPTAFAVGFQFNRLAGFSGHVLKTGRTLGRFAQRRRADRPAVASTLGYHAQKSRQHFRNAIQERYLQYLHDVRPTKRLNRRILSTRAQLSPDTKRRVEEFVRETSVRQRQGLRRARTLSTSRFLSQKWRTLQADNSLGARRLNRLTCSPSSVIQSGKRATPFSPLQVLFKQTNVQKRQLPTAAPRPALQVVRSALLQLAVKDRLTDTQYLELRSRLRNRQFRSTQPQSLRKLGRTWEKLLRKPRGYARYMRIKMNREKERSEQAGSLLHLSHEDDVNEDVRRNHLLFTREKPFGELLSVGVSYQERDLPSRQMAFDPSGRVIFQKDYPSFEIRTPSRRSTSFLHRLTKSKKQNAAPIERMLVSRNWNELGKVIRSSRVAKNLKAFGKTNRRKNRRTLFHSLKRGRYRLNRQGRRRRVRRVRTKRFNGFLTARLNKTTLLKSLQKARSYSKFVYYRRSKRRVRRTKPTGKKRRRLYSRLFPISHARRLLGRSKLRKLGRKLLKSRRRVRRKRTYVRRQRFYLKSKALIHKKMSKRRTRLIIRRLKKRNRQLVGRLSLTRRASVSLRFAQKRSLRTQRAEARYSEEGALRDPFQTKYRQIFAPLVFESPRPQNRKMVLAKRARTFATRERKKSRSQRLTLVTGSVTRLLRNLASKFVSHKVAAEGLTEEEGRGIAAAAYWNIRFFLGSQYRRDLYRAARTRQKTEKRIHILRKEMTTIASKKIPRTADARQQLKARLQRYRFTQRETDYRPIWDWHRQYYPRIFSWHFEDPERRVGPIAVQSRYMRAIAGHDEAADWSGLPGSFLPLERLQHQLNDDRLATSRFENALRTERTVTNQYHHRVQIYSACAPTVVGHSPVRSSFFTRSFYTNRVLTATSFANGSFRKPQTERTYSATWLAPTRLTLSRLRTPNRLKEKQKDPSGRVHLLTFGNYARVREELIATSRLHGFSTHKFAQVVGLRTSRFGRIKSPRNGQYLRRQNQASYRATRLIKDSQVRARLLASKRAALREVTSDSYYRDTNLYPQPDWQKKVFNGDRLMHRGRAVYAGACFRSSQTLRMNQIKNSLLQVAAKDHVFTLASRPIRRNKMSYYHSRWAFPTALFVQPKIPHAKLGALASRLTDTTLLPERRLRRRRLRVFAELHKRYHQRDLHEEANVVKYYEITIFHTANLDVELAFGFKSGM